VAHNQSPWEAEAPDNAQYPRDDNGENFIYFLALAPFRLIAAPFRFVIGIVSAAKMDEEIAKRGVLDGDEAPDIVGEVIQEYGERFYRGRRRKS
jgi:hypothetical protein